MPAMTEIPETNYAKTVDGIHDFMAGVCSAWSASLGRTPYVAICSTKAMNGRIE